MGWFFDNGWVEQGEPEYTNVSDDDVMIVDSEGSEKEEEQRKNVRDKSIGRGAVAYSDNLKMMEDEYRNQVRNRHHIRGAVPDRVNGKTVEEWADEILGYVLQDTHPVMTLFVAGLIAMYSGYTHQDEEWHRNNETVNAWCVSKRTLPMIVRPDGTQFTAKEAIEELA